MTSYDELLKDRSGITSDYAARTLNATTFRMFRKKQSDKIRQFLIKRIVDGNGLANCTASEYIKKLSTVVQEFRRSFVMNTGKRPNFGQAAKPVNLYIKHLVATPSYLISDRRRRDLEKHAHVPLDRLILDRMWGAPGKPGDFREELKTAGIVRRPKLSRLKKKDYLLIQGLLAKAARKAQLPPIAYDYFWAARGR